MKKWMLIRVPSEITLSRDLVWPMKWVIAHINMAIINKIVHCSIHFRNGDVVHTLIHVNGGSTFSFVKYFKHFLGPHSCILTCSGIVIFLYKQTHQKRIHVWEYNMLKTDQLWLFNPLGTGELKFYQSQGLSTFWGLF